MIPEKQLADSRSAALPYLLAPVPALAVGVLTMRMAGVPAVVWGQNLGAWLVGTLLCLALWRTRSGTGRGRWADLAAVLTLGALGATLVAPGVDGVHRWLPAGPLRLHPAAILLPPLLVALHVLSRSRGWWIAALLALGVETGLLLQPDAAQATAFAAGALAVLLPQAAGDARRLACMLALPVLAGLSWLRSDPLAPVPHVEGIVGLAAGMGAGWAVAAAVSLLLLPLPFLLAARGAARPAGFALGAYVAVTVLAAFVGYFPVPVMGYGVSPILGYLAGLGLMPRTASPGE